MDARALWGSVVAALLLAVPASSAFAAGAGTLTVTAVIVSKNNCKFATSTTTSVAVTNNGTNIDPTLTNLASGTATATFTCNGPSPSATYNVVAGDGSYPLGPGARRMRHATVATEFLPYGLAISPSSATVPKGTPVTITFIAWVQATDYQVAVAGNYSDTVAVTVSP